MIKPGQVNCGLKRSRSTQRTQTARMYKAGMTGYPKALYGLSASGFRRRRIKRPIMVRIQNISTAKMR